MPRRLQLLMKAGLLATALCAGSVSATAQSGTEFERSIAFCAALDEPQHRLECYDEVTRQQGLADGPSDQVLPNDWNVASDEVSLSGSPTVLMSVDAKLAGTAGRQATLYLRCNDDVTAFFVRFPDTAIGLGDTVDATLRIGREPAETRRYDVAMNATAFGLWNGTQSIPYIKRLFERRTLEVTVGSDRNEPLSATFDISGLLDAIAPLRQACNW